MPPKTRHGRPNGQQARHTRPQRGGRNDQRGGKPRGGQSTPRQLSSLPPVTLLFATGNANKLRELNELCAPIGVTVQSGAQWRDRDGKRLPNVVEDAPDFVGNALLKAASACRATGLTVLADDSGLAVDALDGAPGVLSARFAGEPRDDGRNIDKLLSDLDGKPKTERGAHFVCALVLCGPAAEGPGCGFTPDGLPWRAYTGRTFGTITTERRGEGGFGYDPVFLSADLKRTFGEAGAEAKHRVSHRGRAFSLLMNDLAASREALSRGATPLFIRPKGLEALVSSIAGTLDRGLRYAGKALAQTFADRPHLGSKERSALSALHWHALRNLSRLQMASDWLTGSQSEGAPDPRTLGPTAAGVLACLTLSDVDAMGGRLGHRDPGERSALDDLIARRKDLAGQLPAPRRQLGKALRATRAALAAAPDEFASAVTAGVHPDFLAALKSGLGDAHAALTLDYLGHRGPPTLRVNPMRATAFEVSQEVLRHGVRSLTPIDLPQALICLATARLTTTELFHDGAFEMQDAGSQRLAERVDAQPGQRVADWCAGAGGKALALAAIMDGKGEIMALDVHATRLSECKRRAKRAGVGDMLSTRAHHANPAHDNDLGLFDRVLVDAPCSSTGALRRTPELRWHLDKDWLERFPAQQVVIALRAAKRVAPGGRLIYATCSLLPSENEWVTEQIQKELPEWTLLSSERIGPASHDYLRSHPISTIGPDGFFCAVLARPE
ncbi:MAG: hypothetical protein KC502_11890 [Myxococcales bacterium]|nr:hypothetical protein [Myxococcales bacterium]